MLVCLVAERLVWLCEARGPVAQEEGVDECFLHITRERGDGRLPAEGGTGEGGALMGGLFHENLPFLHLAPPPAIVHLERGGLLGGVPGRLASPHLSWKSRTKGQKPRLTDFVFFSLQ